MACANGSARGDEFESFCYANENMRNADTHEKSALVRRREFLDDACCAFIG